MRVLVRAVALVAMPLVLALGGSTAATADEPVTSARGTVTSSAPYLMPLEDYAGYQPQSACRQTPKAGVLLLADWLTARGGGYGPISRPCSGSSTSEHKESRAFDWLLDARSDADKALAAALLDEIFAPDDTGAPHALARRMGIMYVIWNDHMYSAWDQFDRDSYLSSSCKRRKRCSPTLRHRDHVHISLSRAGARGKTSWYANRLS